MPHLGERLRSAVPAERRIDEQDRAAFAAIAIRDEERARAQVDIARERGYAEQVESVGGVEREDSGSLRSRADDVVVRQRGAVVRVRAREHIACNAPRIVARRRVGTLQRQFARDPRELRLREHRGNRALRVRGYRHAAVDFLVLDVLRARGAHALDHEVEAVLLVFADSVVVDGGAQELPCPGCERLQYQRLVTRRQAKRAAARPVRDANDERRAAAILEVLFDRVRKRRRLPKAAEDALEFVESGNADGPVHRTAQAAADEGRDGRRRFRN